MTEKLFHVGVKALVTNDDGNILVLRVNTSRFHTNTTAHWDIPGGRIQNGQNTLTTLQREVAEETGVVEIDAPQFFISVISPIEIPLSETEKAGLVLMVYRVTIPADSKIVLSEEHTAYEWVDKKTAAERLSFKYPAEFTSKLMA